MIEIARLFNVAGANLREIVLRLMTCCESFQRLTFANAIAQYRYHESNGLIENRNGYIVIYHNPN